MLKQDGHCCLFFINARINLNLPGERSLLVPYSRKPVTQFSLSLGGTLFSTHALRSIKNKKSGENFIIRILK
jgi:hypothetical protein